MNQASPRTTALTSLHEEAGARMAAFAGWWMPLEFTGTLAEHQAVRTGVGVFDVSHLGTVVVAGTAATATVAGSFSCDVEQVDVGASQYTLCCTARGGIIDDLIAYRLGEDEWMVLPNAANTAAVRARLEAVAASAGADVDIADLSAARAIIAIQGPGALDVATEVLGTDVAAIDHLAFRVLDGQASRGAIVARTGYTGEPGCEVVLANDQAPRLWQRLQDAGAVACGLGARDTLRLEMGYPLHGHELTVDLTPYEARMGWAVKLGHDFVGRDALAEIKAAGPGRRLWGLRTQGRRPLRDGLSVRRDGREVGRVTSGSFSPTLQVGIGLALLDAPVGPGDEVVVDVRGRDVPAAVMRPPFVDRSPKG